MTTWKDGGRFRGLWREVTDENNANICMVWVNRRINHNIEPWPEGEANFRLILAAPQLLEALEAIEGRARLILASKYLTRTRSDWRAVQRQARATIAAVKGDDSDDID